jgi:hypothetical protein
METRSHGDKPYPFVPAGVPTIGWRSEESGLITKSPDSRDGTVTEQPVPLRPW